MHCKKTKQKNKKDMDKLDGQKNENASHSSHNA